MTRALSLLPRFALLALASSLMAASPDREGWSDPDQASRPRRIVQPDGRKADAAQRQLGLPSRRPGRAAAPRGRVPEDRYWSGAFGRPGFDDIVTALVTVQGSLIAGGDFTVSDSTEMRHLARWNGERWEPFAPGIGGECSGWREVWAMTVYRGDLIVAGSFLEAGGQTVNGIARWDGASWSGLASGMGREPGNSECVRVRSLVVFEDRLVAGGSFTRAGGVETGNLAVWDGSSWSAMGGLTGEVFALHVFDGTLVAATSFFRVGDTFYNGPIRWDGSEWHPIGPDFRRGYVFALAVHAGDLVAAGNFEQIGETPVSRIARWDGTSWSGLGSGIGSDADIYTSVDALATIGEDLFAGGSFTQAGGLPAAALARWDGNAWNALDSGLHEHVWGAQVHAFAEHDGRLVVGGDFKRAGDAAADFVAVWDGASWHGMGSSGLGVDGIVIELVEFAGRLAACGRFEQAGALPAHHAALWDGTSWTPMDTGLPRDSSFVSALAVHGDRLYGSLVRTSADSSVSRVVRWDGTGWLAFGDDLNDFVTSMTSFAGELVVAGEFTRAGSTPALRIARWNGAAWLPLGTGLGRSDHGRVGALRVYAGRLVAAGTFAEAGGVPVENIAQWDGQAWGPVGAGLSGVFYAGNVQGLGTHEGALVAVGEFDHAGDVHGLRSVARWDGTTWSGFGSGLDPWGDVPMSGYAVASYGNNLFVAGYFDGAGGLLARNIARWDGARWSALGTGLNHATIALAFYSGHLYAGGLFTTAGGKQSGRIARWSDPAVPIEVTELTATAAAGRVLLAWRLGADALRSVQGVRVQRAPSSAGPFTEITGAAMPPLARMEYEDAYVVQDHEYWYLLLIEHRDGSRTLAGPVAARAGAAEERRLALHPLFEPALGPIEIRFDVGRASRVRLAVYDVRGRLVWAAQPEKLAAGTHVRPWPRQSEAGARVPRGVYIVELASDDAACTRKLVLARP